MEMLKKLKETSKEDMTMADVMNQVRDMLADKLDADTLRVLSVMGQIDGAKFASVVVGESPEEVLPEEMRNDDFVENMFKIVHELGAIVQARRAADKNEGRPSAFDLAHQLGLILHSSHDAFRNTPGVISRP